MSDLRRRGGMGSESLAPILLRAVPDHRFGGLGGRVVPCTGAISDDACRLSGFGRRFVRTFHQVNGMPKLVSVHRQESEIEKAHEYVKTHMLFPAGLLGLISVVSSAAALVYQFVTATYGLRAFEETTGLLAAGVLLGWGQTRYHRYLLRAFPWYFAARMRAYERTGLKKSKKDVAAVLLDHPGRAWVPLGYVLGVVVLLGLSGLSMANGYVDKVAAFLMPWAGFFWAKLFFWRRVLAAAEIHRQ